VVHKRDYILFHEKGSHAHLFEAVGGGKREEEEEEEREEGSHFSSSLINLGGINCNLLIAVLKH